MNNHPVKSKPHKPNITRRQRAARAYRLQLYFPDIWADEDRRKEAMGCSWQAWHELLLTEPQSVPWPGRPPRAR